MKFLFTASDLAKLYRSHCLYPHCHAPAPNLIHYIFLHDFFANDTTFWVSFVASCDNLLYVGKGALKVARETFDSQEAQSTALIHLETLPTHLILK